MTASKEASAVSVSTASGTLVSTPPPVAATPSSRTPHTVSPAVAELRPALRPDTMAFRSACLVRSASATVTEASAVSRAP